MVVCVTRLMSDAKARWPALAKAVRGVCLALALAMLVTGCKSYYPVDISTPKGLQVVSLGETVRVTTHGGEEREFEVIDVEPQRIQGETATYTASQIQALERLESDVLKSLAFGSGVYTLVAVVSAVVLASIAGAKIF